ncbi:uncharacterized protein N7484_005352 [Penicillium longicatenatum]|uniref:uncharacterized protein n=1 Tax=Penicillium longicatenatum TaxID=1561947 RepID=UPI002548E7F3|nr:uncharacterized protein N7484_005352 [Penicillium longicatenatum]KAJ5651629.1 hypothetical protein N7484_005352 [Penicillium longicatenatum]
MDDPSLFPSNDHRVRRSGHWHEYREIIEQLYRTDQLKLRDVKRIMEQEYKEKQYKDRLAAWNVRKNIKAAEFEIMIHKKQKSAAQGKRTAFRRAGHVVDDRRIARFARRSCASWVRHRDQDTELRSPEPATETPSNMSCYTPEPEQKGATTASPPDQPSPTREVPPFPLSCDASNIETMSDLVIDDDRPYQMIMHNTNSRKNSFSSDHVTHAGAHLVSHSIHTATQPLLPSPSSPALYLFHDNHHPGQHATVASASVVPFVPVHRGDIDPPGELVTNSDDWNRLDAFQTRLEGLQHTLNLTMSKWDREPDPNIEFTNHEGLGM